METEPTALDRRRNSAEIHAIIDQYKQMIKQDKNYDKDLMLFIETRATTGQIDRENNESFELALHIQKNLLSCDSETEFVFIVGKSGSGKTLFCKYLQRSLLLEWNVQDEVTTEQWLPIYVDCARYEAFNAPEMITKTLSNEFKLVQKQIELLRNASANKIVRPLLIFDGLENIREPQFLKTSRDPSIDIFQVVSQLRNYWKYAKIIFTSRVKLASEIHDFAEERRLGDPDNNIQKASAECSYLEYTLQGFTDSEITAYLRKYTVLGNIDKLERPEQIFSPSPLKEPSWSLEKDDEDIIECFELKELLRVPFLLCIASDVLFDFIDSEKQITLWDIYEYFTNKQMKTTVQKYLYHKTSKELAKGVEEESSLLKLLKHELQRKAILTSNYALYLQPKGEKTREEYLNKLMLFCPLLKWDQTILPDFIHTSIAEYLIAKTIEEDLIQMSNNEQMLCEWNCLLNQKLLDRDSLVLKYLSDSVKNGKISSKVLLLLIEETKVHGKLLATQRAFGNLNKRLEQNGHYDSNFSLIEKKSNLLHEENSSDTTFNIAAANAMMILNASGFKFSGIDLSYACVPYADLSSGSFEKTNFSYADLEGVDFTRANLKDVILTGANLKDAKFGGFPKLEINEEVSCLNFSPSNKFIAAGIEEGIAIFEFNSAESSIFKRVKVLKQNTDNALHCVFSPDSRHLVSAGSDHLVRLWDIEKGLFLREFEVSKGTFKHLQFSPDGQQLVTTTVNQNSDWIGTVETVIQLWDLKTGVCKQTITENSNISVVEYSPDGRKLLLSGGSGAIRAIKPLNYKIITKYRDNRGYVLNLCKFSPSGSKIAVLTKSRSILIWDSVRRHFVKSLKDNSKNYGAFSDFSFDQDARNLILTAKFEIIVQNIATGEQFKLFTLSSDTSRIAISSDQRFLAIQKEKNPISIHEIKYNNDIKGYFVDIGNEQLHLKGANVDSAFQCSEKNALLFWQFGDYGYISETIMENLILDSSNSRSIREIKLTSQRINDAGGAIIGRNLAWINLEELDLENNNIGDKATEAIGHNNTWTKLRRLNLSANAIENRGAISIGNNFTWESLEELNLSKNSIHEGGAISIGANTSWKELKILNLNGNKIGFEDALSISKNIVWTKLHTLDLGSNSIGTAGAVEISKNAAWVSLTTLDLSWNKIGASGVASLLNNTAWKKIETINLSCNSTSAKLNIEIDQNEWENLRIINLQRSSLTDSCLTKLSRITAWKNLKTLNLAENHFSPLGIEEFSQSCNLLNLELLNLAETSLCDEGVSELSKNLSWTNLSSLNIGWNNITAAGAVLLSQNTSWLNLKVLILSGNTIGAAGATALSKNATWKALEALHLENNLIGDEGAISLGQSEAFPGLKLLLLADNCIGNTGCLALSKNKVWVSLEVLNLAENSIGASGTAELKSNNTWVNIQTINLEGNSIGVAGTANLIKNQNWVNMQVINLEGNSIGALGAAELSKGSIWKNVRVLNLGCNGIGNSGVKVLSQNETWVNLEDLSLHYNSISDEGAEDLGKNVSWINLATLNLERNSISDQGARRLSQNTSWKNLETLNLHLNLILHKGLRYLRNNPHWVHLKNIYY